MSKINTPSGFRDLLPKEARERNFLVRTISSIYQKFGFSPFDTPVAEFQDVIVGDKADDFNLFFLESNKASSHKSKESIALRFDLTVPLARAVGQYGDKLPRPFKRYQIGEVFRGERPQKGRYRQFLQLDADVVGSSKIETDIEMILMMHEIMSNFVGDKFIIRVSSRKLINLLPEFLDFDTSILQDIVVLVDKSEKITQEEFLQELTKLGLNNIQNEAIVSFASISEDSQSIVQVLDLFFKKSKLAQDVISEIAVLSRACCDIGISSNIRFDMNIVRGFGYYTGTVFETNVLGGASMGSVLSGGRYDNLMDNFSNESLPSVGVSAGVDRMHTVFSELGIFSKLINSKKVVIFYRDDIFSMYALNFAQSIRVKASDFEVDVYSGNKRDFKDIFKYCELVEATHLCIVDKREFDIGGVTVRDLITREQETYSCEDAVQLFSK